MKYYINHNIDGKIVGFVNQSTGINTEVTNAQYVDGQKNNKIIITDGVITFEKADWRTQDEIISEKVSLFTSYVDEVIAKEISDYNTLNKTAFTDENSVEKYNKAGAFHYAFASSLISWIVSGDVNVGLWAKARLIQDEVLLGTRAEPTKEEFIALLPKRV